MTTISSFDVFLSHNSKDKPHVRQLGVALKNRGLNVWLDEWELVPGRLDRLEWGITGVKPKSAAARRPLAFALSRTEFRVGNLAGKT